MVVWERLREVFKRIVDKCSKPKINMLVLGFYNRGNMGDEQYKVTIPLCFSDLQSSELSFDFVSIDDVGPLPANSKYDVILCGGGDIINAYFMEKVKRVIGDFTGKVYAISVGIPYDADVFYLDLFDHVFVRNNHDAELAASRLGTANVTKIPDVGFLYPVASNPPSSAFIQPVRLKNPTVKPIIHIGFCLATPVYRNHPDLRAAVPHFIKALLHMSAGATVHIHFFHFNSFEENSHESDFESTVAILGGLSFVEQQRCSLHKISKPDKMIESLRQMNLNVCMRYHSVVFSLLAKVPFIAVYANKKVKMLLEDVHYPPHLSFDIGQGCDWSQWIVASKEAIQRREAASPASLPSQSQPFSSIANVIASNTSRTLMVVDNTKSLEQALSSVKSMMDAYFGYMYCTKEVVRRKGCLDIGSKDPLQVARIICYAITGNIDDPCIWGLSENMRRSDFCLYEAIQYIHTNCTNNTNKHDDPLSAWPREVYHPKCDLPKRVFITIDPFTKIHLAKNVHRSGWAYVLSHLMNLHGPHFQRPHKLIVDTYMDRTFHWGMDAMLLNGVLPYRTNWVGFLHHTFDTVHSKYNCEEMFHKQAFRESLGTCKGIIVLSNYLADQVKAKLKEYHLPAVDVHVLYHPTEFVEKEYMFSFSKFEANPNKKIVQIGAWLRNPYAIYKLPLADDILNPLCIKKAVLKGTNMEGYFASSHAVEKMIGAIMRGCDPNTAYTYDCISRDALGTMDNKYVDGMCATIREYHNSVEVITNLSNEAYDELLANNIVFLQLQDCSAVNTVIECIVRNTILVVNRHPALEELLGESYPGFYDENNLVVASLILNDPKRLQKCYAHLKKLDKTQLKIETFMKRFVDIVQGMIT